MYALLVERNQDMAYKDLIIKIEKQFGFRELPETAQVQFSNARQTPEELLEDRADRVLSLATRAYRALPEKHMYQQAVVRFCQGAADKEAMHPISGLQTLKRPLTKCGGISITIRLFMGALLGGR
jgi:anion-transporting  ArsA/GET3 family ATPase